MAIARKVLTVAVPVAVAVIALLNAKAVSELVGATLQPSDLLPSLPAAHAATAAPAPRARSADAILDRNPFDHETGSLLPKGGDVVASSEPVDPRDAPECAGVRAIVVVRGEDQQSSMAALDVGGKHVVRRAGGDVAGMHLAWVGRDRVWMETGSGVCQAKVFGATPPPVIQPVVANGDPPGAGALERSLKIVKLSATEIQIDRGSVDRLLEAQTELMKARLVQEKEGDRVVGMRIFGIKPGSALDMLAIQNGDRLESVNGAEMSSPEKMLELYARLKTAAVDRFTIHVVRQGKPLNIDYTIR